VARDDVNDALLKAVVRFNRNNDVEAAAVKAHGPSSPTTVGVVECQGHDSDGEPSPPIN
jgi:hypothetical protein